MSDLNIFPVQDSIELVEAPILQPDGSLVGMPPPQILVVFGGSGDLAKRKLYPALAALAKENRLNPHFVVVGMSRSPISDEQFQELCRESTTDTNSDAWNACVSRFRYISGDYADKETFDRLAQLLSDIDETDGTLGNRIYYLATTPALFSVVSEGLAYCGANVPSVSGAFVRIVVEKPFGVDLASAKSLDEDLHDAFSEEQIYRIDHYMAKETVQNVLALRFANTIFEPIWNRRYVDHVQVTVAEDLGVEHRGAFYETAGALRDIVQNHVMQVLSLTLMEPPVKMNAQGIHDEKIKLLRSILIPDADAEADKVVRGQYGRGSIGGVAVPAYREEEGVAPNSQTETFVAMVLAVDNWRWAGVPIYIRTGKRLARRATEVTMVFQRPPHLPFAGNLTRDLRPDALTLRIQPDEGVSLDFGAKVPGSAFRIRTVNMDFSYARTFSEPSADAYERLLHDTMIGDATLFIRSDEVQCAWSIVTPIQQIFADPFAPLATYKAGSWGPADADRLIETSGRRWSNP